MPHSTFLKHVLLDEVAPLLEGLEERVLVLETHADTPALFALFMPLHQIKGVGEFLEQPELQLISQQLLSILEDIRHKNLEVSSELTDALLEIVQGFKSMLHEFQSYIESHEEAEKIKITEWTSPVMEGLKEQIEKLCDPKQKAPVPPPAPVAPVIAPLHFSIKWPPGLRGDFMTESQEGLFSIEDTLLTLEGNLDQLELYNELFRTLHTLKGNAGVMLATIPDESIRHVHPLTPFRDLSHRLESLVAFHRDEQKAFTHDGIDLLIKTNDTLKILLISISKDDSSSIDLHPLFLALKQYSATTEGAQIKESSKSGSPSKKEVPPETLAFLNIAEQSLDIISTLIPKLSDVEQRPAALKKYRRAVQTLHKAGQSFENPNIQKEILPLFDELGRWKTEEPEGIKELLISAEGALERLQHEIHLLQSASDPNTDLASDSEKTLPPKIESQKTVIPPVTPASKASPAAPSAIKDNSFLRVPHERVDRLMNLIGELIISKNSFAPLTLELNQNHQLKMAQKVKLTGSSIGRIADALQSEIMEIRMVPVSTIFSRFTRLIRDLSKMTGKKFNLEIKGENTLLDKSILEQINDPLMHLLRNSADHGIEAPEERTRLGKEEEGTLRLSATQKGHMVLLKVEDDGQGMDRDKIAFKAVSMGLLVADDLEEMSDEAIYSLIFHPGFSTADHVTEVSGRGVGMDVVNSTVKKLRGSIDVESTPGKGSCITLSLPLSLAVSRGLMLLSGEERFILPIDTIRELLKVPASRVRHFHNSQRLVEIRGKVFPIISLAEALGGERTELKEVMEQGQEPSIALAVIAIGEQSFALEVDRFLHEVEIMVKPIQESLGKIPGIIGTTILSDGNVLLILNPADLAAHQ